MIIKLFQMILLLAFFIVLPLIVHFPLHLYRRRHLKRVTGGQGPWFAHSMAITLWSIWLISVVLDISLIVIPYLVSEGRRADQRRVQQDLQALYTSQKAYYMAHNTYAGRTGQNGKGAFTDLKWAPAEKSRYAFYLGEDYLPPSKGPAQTRFRLDASWPFQVRPGVTANGFTAVAIGNLDRDPCLDTWRINDAGDKVQLEPDLDEYYYVLTREECAQSKKGTNEQKGTNDIFIIYIIMLLNIVMLLLLISSPALVFAVPFLYYLVIRQNRLYHEVLAEIEDGAAEPERNGHSV